MTVRPLNRFEAASLGVAVKANGAASGLKGRSVAGEVDAPAFEISRAFNYQSYFDDTLLQNAILAAPSNEPIIPSTLSDPIQVSGYGVGLHPSSETPIAVRFQTGSQQGASMTYRIKPGEIIRPHGSMHGQPGSFSGLEWGLPFGWLGGGLAKLIVLRTPDAESFWTGNPEIIFHRTRMEILAPGAVPVAALTVLNWPKRFPWPSAQFGASAILQSGQPALGVSPTRTAFRLRLATLPAFADMRVLYIGTNDFSFGTAGTPVLTDVAFNDMTWGSFIAAGIVTPGTPFPTQILTGQQERFAADGGGVALVDLSGGSLTGAFVDIVRYGNL
jgi:hypothetical protein